MQIHCVQNEGSEVGFLELKASRAALDAGNVEHVGNEAAKATSFLDDEAEILAALRLGAHTAVLQPLGEQLHRRAVPERSAFARLAPLVAALQDWKSWPRAERVALGAMLLSKGAAQEAPYARSAVAHPRFFLELAALLATMAGRRKGPP